MNDKARRVLKSALRTCALFVLAIYFATLGCNEGATVGTDIGRKAPEISGESVAGIPVKLSQYQGKVVLLDFWATWCGPCVNLVPHEKDLHRQFDTRPFQILGISADNKREDLKAFVDREKLPWPNIYDGGGTIRREWGVQSFPTFVLIDHKGIVIGRWSNGNPQVMSEIEKAVEEAVREADKQQK